jgi:hypothetical protein
MAGKPAAGTSRCSAATTRLPAWQLGCGVVLCCDGPVHASAVALAAYGVRVCADLAAKVEGEPDRYVRLRHAGRRRGPGERAGPDNGAGCMQPGNGRTPVLLAPAAQVIMAAAQGALAAVAIDQELLVTETRGALEGKSRPAAAT